MIPIKLLRLLAALAASAGLLSADAQAANVTLSTGDAINTSSFNASGGWSNAAAPAAGNNYFTGTANLRTPDDGNSYTFAGDSLTITNITADTTSPAWSPSNPTTIGTGMGGFWYKGNSTARTITVNNLIVDGGLIVALDGPDDNFNLAGNVNVTANSYFYAKQGPMNISAAISGSASITNPGSDSTGRTLRFMSPSNTFSGNLINNGRFELADNGKLNFVIGANGVNNSVSGTGAETVFNGDFAFNLSGAGATLGNSWSIVTATNRSFGSTFSVAGFSEYSAGQWINGIYQFDEATGVLSVIDPPDLLTLRVNTASGVVSVVNNNPSGNFEMNYYEIRSAVGALSVGNWTSIDGDIPATTTSWEKAGGSSATLISETNLLGMEAFGPAHSVSVGHAYAGTSLAQQNLEFYYGTVGGGSTLIHGNVEYVGGAAGDYSGGSGVNAADYVLWRTTDDTVAGYDRWRTNFGNSSGSIALNGTSVPEPATWQFLLVGATVWLVWLGRSSLLRSWPLNLAA